MKCLHCAGSMKLGKAPFQVNRHGYHLTLDEVPAWVCTQCGEPFFDEKQVEDIQQMIQTLDDQSHRWQKVA